MIQHKTFIYFHICTLKRYKEVVQRIMDNLLISGVLDDVSEVRYVVLGDDVEEAQNIMETYPKTRCLFTDPDISLYERATLHRLREDCMAMQEPAHILYIHSKGITKPPLVHASIQRWTDAMLDGLTTYRHLCWRALDEGCNAVGSFLTKGCLHWETEELLPDHFSGNFWWSSSTHIASLPLIGPAYVDPELWVTGSLQNSFRVVAIDNLSLRPDGGLYLHAPTLQEYRASIVFEGLARNVVVEDAKTVEMGLKDKWVFGIIPSPGPRVSLSMAMLGIDVNPHPGAVKMVLVTLISGDVLYFLENEVVSWN